MWLRCPRAPAIATGLLTTLVLPSGGQAGSDRGYQRAAGADLGSPAVMTLHAGTNPVAVAIDSSASQVLIASQGVVDRADRPLSSGTVTFLDERTGAVLHTVGVGVAPRAIAVDTRYHQAYVLSAGPLGLNSAPVGAGSVSVLDTRTGRLIQSIPVGTAPSAIIIDSQRGRAFIVNREGESLPHGGYASGTISVIDTLHHTVIATVPGGYAVAEDRQTGHIFVASPDDSEPFPSTYAGKVRMLDAATGSLLGTVPVPQACGIAIDETAHRALIVSEIDRHHGRLTLLDSASGARVQTAALAPTGCGQHEVVIDSRRGRAFVSAGPSYDQLTSLIVQVDSRVGKVLHVQPTTGEASMIGLDSTNGRLFVVNITQRYQADGRYVRTTELLDMASATCTVRATTTVGSTIFTVLDGAVDGKAQKVFLIVLNIRDIPHPVPASEALALDTSHLP